MNAIVHKSALFLHGRRNAFLREAMHGEVRGPIDVEELALKEAERMETLLIRLLDENGADDSMREYYLSYLS